jgi:uncharacterized integral membrane protein
VSYLKLILALGFMVVILFFGFINMEEHVTVHLSTSRQGEFRDVSLALVLFFSYLAGIVTFAVVSLLRDLRTNSHLSRLKRENRKLLDELHQLRSVTLDDLPRRDEVEGEL